jgi:uncharacterized membrane protein YraQ (UPF0718 family)
MIHSAKPESTKRSSMLGATLFMAVVAIVLLVLSWQRGRGEHIQGLQTAAQLSWQTLPLLLLAFLVAGLIQALLPREVLARWIGESSGWRGILVGTVAGGLMPGGPYVNLPVAAALMRGGAGVGTMVAFLTGWSLWAVARLPMEVGILGWRLTAIRIASTFFFPPIAGWIAHALFGEKS